MNELQPDAQAVTDTEEMILQRKVQELVRGHDEPELIGALKEIVSGKSDEEQRELIKEMFSTLAILMAGKEVNQLLLPEAYGAVAPSVVAVDGMKGRLGQR